MQLELSEEQEFFRDTTRKFLVSEMPLSSVRELYESVDGFDRSWWLRAAELGWTSIFVPEALGGGSLSGRPTSDAVIVAEEIGRLVAPGPFLPVNVVSASLTWFGSEAQRMTVLPGLLEGTQVATWAFAEPGGRWGPDSVGTTVAVSGDEVVIDGVKAYVEAAGVADWFLVTARTVTAGGLTQVLVPRDVAGLTVERGRSVDMTRRFGTVVMDGVTLPATAVVGAVGRGGPPAERLWELALALECAEMVGIADRTLEFTIDYGRDRFAFGRPIVSFQALKHRIANMTVWSEGCKAITEALAIAIDTGDPESPKLASVAKAYVGEHCLDIVDDCVQMTGGMGVTWEHDIHLYNRRAIVDQAVYGGPEDHKERLATLLGAVE